MPAPAGSKPKLAEQYTLNEVAADGVLSGLSQINLFVGPNNSGKSRLLRALFWSENLEFTTSLYDPERLEIEFKEICDNLSEKIRGFGAIDAKVDSKRHEMIPPIWTCIQQFRKQFVSYSGSGFIQDAIAELKKLSPENLAHDLVNRAHLARPHLEHAIADSIELLEKRGGLVEGSLITRRVYIPILRNLRCSESLELFRNTTMKDYFKSNFTAPDDSMKNKTLFTGLEIYESLIDHLLGSSETRANVLAYERFLSDTLFNGKRIEIIPNRTSKTVHLTIDDKDDTPIFNLGDGIQSLLLLTFDAFFSDRPTLYFVEEPEIYLHPGLQRKLLELLTTHPKMNRHQWMFASHSNHLLDLTIDFNGISIYGVERTGDKFAVSLKSSGDHSLLKSLGALGSSVFRSNCSVWVEGITDRAYLRAFLKLRAKSKPFFASEDLHYSFVEFGGSNLTHFNFGETTDGETTNVKRLVGKSFLLLDGDNEQKGERVSNIRSWLPPDQFHVLSCKEIENVLPTGAVKFACRKLIETSKNLKDQKAVILAEVDKIREEDYFPGHIPLGAYLDKTLGIKDGYFAAPSGTIADKVRFSDYATEFLASEAPSLNSEVEALLEKLSTFIHSHNTALKNSH